MNCSFVKFAGLVYFFFLCGFSHAVEIELHPEEKPFLDSIINQLSINKHKIVTSNLYSDDEERRETDFYRKYGEFKKIYFHDGENSQKIDFRINNNGRIVSLRISSSDLIDLRDIQFFRELILLDLSSTKISVLPKISRHSV